MGKKAVTSANDAVQVCLQFGKWLFSVAWRGVTLLTGGIIAAIILLWNAGHDAEHQLSLQTDLMLGLLGALFASFWAWRGVYLELHSNRLRPWMLQKAKNILILANDLDGNTSDECVQRFWGRHPHGEQDRIYEHLKTLPMPSYQRDQFQKIITDLPSSPQTIRNIGMSIRSIAYLVPEDALL